MQVTVTHLEGSKAGQTETFDTNLVSVGRDPSNVLSFDPNVDIDVSSRHAQLVAQGDMLMVQDLGSRNGTFVNGQKIMGSTPVPVPNGGTVQFGDKGPKITVSYAAGPGKRTLEFQAKIADTEAALAGEKSKRSSGRMIACCIVMFILMGAGAGGVFMWKQGGNKELLAKITTNKKTLQTTRDEAQKRSLTDFAKDEWAKVETAEAAGKTAETAGDLVKADEQFALAASTATTAMGKAGEEQLAAEKKRGEQLQKEFEAEKARLAEEQAKKDKEIQEQREKEEKEKKDREKALADAGADAKKLTDAAAKAKESKNEGEVKNAVTALEEALKKNPNDEALKKEIEALKKRLAEITGLAGAAKAASKNVLVVMTQTFAIPAGQREDTTSIRASISEGVGTGFYTAKDRLVTAKEVVEPWKFDPKALATHTKLVEKGWQVKTRISVWELNAQNVYVETHKADAGEVEIARLGEESRGDEQKVKIPFDNAEVEVPVKPHKRDETDWALLSIKGKNVATPLALSDKDAVKVGDKVIMLGEQKAGPGLAGLKPGEMGLFQLEGALKEAGDRPLVSAGSFSSWVGGPVLDGSGKVVGVIVETGKETRLLSTTKIKTN